LKKNGFVEGNWKKDFISKVQNIQYHIATMFRPTLLPHPGVFSLFAVDFSIDKNINLSLNEIVPRPMLEVPDSKKLDKQYTEIVMSMTAM